MASISVVPTTGVRDNNENMIAVNKLYEEMNDMKIRDGKVDASFVLIGFLIWCP